MASHALVGSCALTGSHRQKTKPGNAISKRFQADYMLTLCKWQRLSYGWDTITNLVPSLLIDKAFQGQESTLGAESIKTTKAKINKTTVSLFYFLVVVFSCPRFYIVDVFCQFFVT
jgi:hypothetical protein